MVLILSVFGRKTSVNGATILTATDDSSTTGSASRYALTTASDVTCAKSITSSSRHKLDISLVYSNVLRGMHQHTENTKFIGLSFRIFKM